MAFTPKFTLDEIHFGTDPGTFERAIGLYENNKVTKVKDNTISYTAIVQGTQPYQVCVEARRYDYGHCNCYIGQKEMLCKHLVALAIAVVQDGRPLTPEEIIIAEYPEFSGRLGELTANELQQVRSEITKAIRYIKPYRGPSRTWFKYQDSLSEGCRRLVPIVSCLPVSQQTAGMLVNLLLRLDKKLRNGVDDSDGTVGGFMYSAAEVLQEFAQLDPSCISTFTKIVESETCFEWDEELVRILDEHR